MSKGKNEFEFYKILEKSSNPNPTLWKNAHFCSRKIEFLPSVFISITFDGDRIGFLDSQGKDPKDARRWFAHGRPGVGIQTA